MIHHGVSTQSMYQFNLFVYARCNTSNITYQKKKTHLISNVEQKARRVKRRTVSRNWKS